MKILYTSLLFLMNCVLSVAQPEVIIPKPHQLKWHEAEMGAVFHYDLHVFDGIRYGQGNNRISPIEDYNIFNPTQLDTDQWIQAAKAAGCKFAVLTATHETGFGLWQSDVNPYCLKAVKWRDGKGDIVRDFVNSCRKYGIQPGIYVGIRWNSLLGIHNFKVAGDGEFEMCIRDRTWETVQSLNIGFDLGMFRNRLNINFDYFIRKTLDMVGPASEVASIYGIGMPASNNTDLRTKGWEVAASWRDRIGQVNYNIGFNMADSRSFVDKYPNCLLYTSRCV